MKKTILLNLSDLKFEGDVIDFSGEDFSIVEESKSEGEKELALDSEVKNLEGNFDTGVIFFNLNNIWSKTRREEIINEIMNCINKKGHIYIWDLNRSFGEVVDIELKMLLPNNSFKTKKIKSNNIFSCLNLEEIEKILEKNCEIEETKVWEDMFFIKAQKI